MKPVFSDAHWKEIKQSLAAVGVNADTHSVLDPRFSYPFATMQPLRDVLERYANFHNLEKPPTPFQQAKDLRETQAALKQMLATLKRLSTGTRNYPDYPEIHTYRARDGELHDLMAWKIDSLQTCIKRLRALGSSSKHSRRTVQHKYWQALTDLWIVVTLFQNKKHPLPKKRLGQFLAACSRPLFGNVSEGEIKLFLTHVRLRNRRVKSDRRLRTLVHPQV
jgi:hypothetical protein